MYGRGSAQSRAFETSMAARSRPLSPHLSIYRFTLTMTNSIVQRGTGMAMYFGTLLIVLWLIWVLHAQISGHLNRLNAIALLAALSMVVAIAWFGVNLLSVGLHSYGFITGVAAGLAAFLALESCIITGLYWKITKNGTAA